MQIDSVLLLGVRNVGPNFSGLVPFLSPETRANWGHGGVRMVLISLTERGLWFAASVLDAWKESVSNESSSALLSENKIF